MKSSEEKDKEIDRERERDRESERAGKQKENVGENQALGDRCSAMLLARTPVSSFPDVSGLSRLLCFPVQAFSALATLDFALWLGPLRLTEFSARCRFLF